MPRRAIVLLAAAVVGTAVLLAVSHWRIAQSNRPAPEPPAEVDRVAGLFGRSGPVPGPDDHAAPLPTGTGEVVTLDDRGRVTRRVPGGPVRWSVTLDGRAGGRSPPHLLADADRVYVTHGDGVTALAVADGAVAWHAPGPAERMLLSGDRLLAAECWYEKEGGADSRWAVARDAATGREVFRVRLPVKEFAPLPIEEAAGLFLVQGRGSPDDKGLAVLLNRSGAEHHRFDRRVVAVRAWAGGRLVLTGRDVVRLAAAGKAEWTAPFRDHEWLAGGGFVPLPGGGVAAYRYCPAADSGVRVLRFDPFRGGVAWETHCPGLRVEHSGYNHAADVELEGHGQLRVISRGMAGVFVEVLDLGTGRSVHRERRD